MRHFRWSRQTYKHAARLSRIAHLYCDPCCFPLPLSEYRRLWADYEWKHGDLDPLATPLRTRLDRFKNPEIPF